MRGGRGRVDGRPAVSRGEERERGDERTGRVAWRVALRFERVPFFYVPVRRARLFACCSWVLVFSSKKNWALVDAGARVPNFDKCLSRPTSRQKRCVRRLGRLRRRSSAVGGSIYVLLLRHTRPVVQKVQKTGHLPSFHRRREEDQW